jgi:hypothetical protein
MAFVLVIPSLHLYHLFPTEQILYPEDEANKQVSYHITEDYNLTDQNVLPTGEN